ncbi:DddA-like double-stranded DNA deaminase toxin [Streptomyces flaveolus]|uniref:DddA-like double-stranded DNA deaminase toxin n=1 Tax=Streptomyces flaveolus TaxID=67297 RepID=UPI003F53F998
MYCGASKPDGTADTSGDWFGDSGSTTSNRGTAATGSNDPTPAPSPGPTPTPGPYKGNAANDPILSALKFVFNKVFEEPEPQLWCNADGSYCEYMQVKQAVVPWVPGPGWARAMGIGRGAAGFKELAARMLPEFIEGKATAGVGTTSTGRVYQLVSGNKKADSELIGIVNKTLQEKGVLKAKSARASDVEQKMAAIMIRDGLDKAEIVINNPTGPCRQPLGCHQTLGPILGKRELTVHWPDGAGGWRSWTYGGAK